MRGAANGSLAAEGAGRARADADLRVLAEALEESPSAVVITDAAGCTVYANRPFAEMLGHDRADLIGTNLFTMGPLSAEHRSQLRAALDAGQTWQAEFRSKKANGGEIWVSTSVSPIRDANGVVTHFLGINEEIPDPKRAEEARAQAEEPAGSVADAAPDYVMVVDPDGTILFTNTTAPGVSREEAIGASVYDFAQADHHDRLRKYLQQVVDTGEAVSYEIASLGLHGANSIFATRVGPIKRRGRVVALAITTIEITERKRPEETLQESVERFRSLSEASFEAIVIHDKGKILDVNSALASMSGHDPHEVIGMHMFDFLAPESRDLAQKHTLSGYEKPYEVIALRKDGTTFPAEACGKAILYRGRMVRAVAIRDITERKRRMKAIDQAAAPAAVAREHDLSERELEVLQLLAQGLTNREVAERLRVSLRTIDHHVSHVLNKLQVPNRTAAVVAAEQLDVLPRDPPR